MAAADRPVLRAAAPTAGILLRVGAVLLLSLELSACAGSRQPPPLQITRERNYLCQQLAPGETIEDETLCEENKHWIAPDRR
jgi:hypothetical protein